jgi:hypothetical protein
MPKKKVTRERFERHVREGEVFEFLDSDQKLPPEDHPESFNQKLQHKPKATPIVGRNVANPLINPDHNNYER